MYTAQTIERAKLLRSKGNTFREINKLLQTNIPKSTFSTWFRGILLPKSYYLKVKTLSNLDIARKVQKQRRDRSLTNLFKSHFKMIRQCKDVGVQKLLLSILYLGEGGKYKTSSLTLASSNPKIIQFYMQLLRNCYKIDDTKFRARIQGRCDQNGEKLIKYWKKTINIHNLKFYPYYTDMRTLGKPTQKLDYKGVCTISYFDTKIQIDLEMLSIQVMGALTYEELNSNEVIKAWTKIVRT